MAETLCGPSNPLQNIQKHTAVDRTLQQDRLAIRQQPNQDFRSSTGSRAGHLDAEFEAFRVGNTFSNSGGQDFSFNRPRHLEYAGGLPAQQPPQWASDFQRLSFDSVGPPPIPSSQFRNEAPIQRHIAGDWHQEFLRNQGQSSAVQLTATSRLGGNAWKSPLPQQQFPSFNAPGSYLSETAFQKQPATHFDNVFDETAFEKAFDTARMEAMGLETPKGKERDTATMAAGGLGVEKSVSWDTEYDTTEESNDLARFHQQSVTTNELLEVDLIDDKLIEEEDPSSVNDEDDLARTAGQLLDNLKHEQSQKFQESNFMALMRQLRDKEVRVEGDRMVDATQPLHPGGQFYPNDENRNTGYVTATTE